MASATGSCFVLSVAVFWRGVAFLEEPQCFLKLLILLFILLFIVYSINFLYCL